MRSAVIGLPPYRIFSLEELEEATDNFDSASLLCEQLYRGSLREGIAVTVKCIKLKQKNLPQSLAQQMEVLSKLRHQHLIENIMLEETLTVKISGYIIPLPSKVGVERLQAKTPRSNEDGDKEDVYQFGVILLQIITSKVVAAGSSEMGSLKLHIFF